MGGKLHLEPALQMLFSHSKALTVFYHFVNKIIQNLLYKCVVIYLDNTLAFSLALASHKQHACYILQCLQKNLPLNF